MTLHKPTRTRPYPAIPTPKAEGSGSARHSEGICIFPFHFSPFTHSVYHLAGAAQYDCEMLDQHGLSASQ